MEIISWQFALFVSVVVGVYYVLPHRAQNYWLLLASYIFYLTWGWNFALVLLCLTTFNFLWARLLTPEHSRRRLWLWIGIIANVTLLSFYKLNESEYAARFGLTTKFLLPIGLAFYTLQAISYLVDVYNKVLPPTSNWADFFLYLSYFPKLLAGPIERARNFLPTLAKPRVVTNEKLAKAVALIMIGLFRKIVIADVLSQLIVLEKAWVGWGANYSSPVLILWLLSFAFALYNDFAGYTSIVRGVSLVFGIELAANFQQPYLSRNFAEFWNRWHVSFSHWLRDYIYYPLSRWLARLTGSQRNVLSVVAPPLVTMTVSGLWHGFHPYLLIWGGLHGLYQIVERVWSLYFPVTPPDQQPRWRQALGTLTVFGFTTLAWVAFAMPTLRNGGSPYAFWRAMSVSAHWTEFGWEYLLVFLPIAFSLGLDAIQNYYRDEVIFLRWNIFARALLFAAACLLLFIVSVGGAPREFVYQGF